MPTRPVLIVNPRDDSSFGARAEGLVEQGVAGAADLQARLRDSYPRATVRPRELSSEQTVVWYVYRDGHWVPPGRAEEERP
jgi:hypothetical protein